MRALLTLVFLSVVAACGGGGSDDDAGNPDAPPGTDPDANNDGWTRLIGREWSIPQGVLDVYKCTRILVEQDTYISAFRSLAPPGSHHAVLTISTQAGQLGDYDCSVGSLDFRMLYASGVGTDDLVFPTDVGVRIPAGSYLNLNLHLFNAGDTEISGDSGVLVRTLPAAPATLADMTFAGDVQLAIPGDNQPHVESCGCTLNRSFTSIAWWPHMHQFAIHQKLEVRRDGVTTVLHDDDYSFTDQLYYTQNTPFEFMSGDQVTVSCTYRNPGPGTVTWGDSSTEEMCFTGMYQYPAANNLFSCVNGIPPL